MRSAGRIGAATFELEDRRDGSGGRHPVGGHRRDVVGLSAQPGDQYLVEIQDYESQSKATSSGQRIELWSHAIKLIAQAPVTAMAPDRWPRLQVGHPGRAFGHSDADNPHTRPSRSRSSSASSA